eukprot:14125271-Alexandrium_andersonii.AAC.1
MGGCGVQPAEARLAASFRAGSTAAPAQALAVVRQGVERLVGGSCLDMPPEEAQKIVRDLGVSHSVVALDTRAAAQVGIKQVTTTKQ